MSSEGIDRRLRELGELHRFGIELEKMKRLGPVNPEAKVDFEELERLLAIHGDQLRAESRAVDDLPASGIIVT
jgi:chromosome segregation ATPase